ncbi:MAG: efflux RND transporter permease subunit [Deltaproteobacteria bacterium]|nr:efflux RND transporter permease subunit [Deltaproteobacteria bacterium]
MRRVGPLCVGLLALVVALSCNRGAPMSHVRIGLKGTDAQVAVAVVERAVESVAGKASVRTVACSDAAVVSVSMGAGNADVAAAAAVNEALAKVAMPPHVTVDVRAVADEIVVFAVRGPDPFVARKFVDAQLKGALSSVAGVVVVKVVGGKQEKQVRVDLERLMARDLTLSEVAAAAGGGASLEATVVRDPDAAPNDGMMKAVLPPPGPNAVLLTDVASVGLASAGEPLRRDGAVEVRVLGSAAARVAVLKAALGVSAPEGITVSALDDDSIEGVDVVVVDGTAAQLQDVQRAALSIPGVRLADEPYSVRVVVDTVRAALIGVHVHDVERVAAMAAGDGLVLLRNTENVVVRLDRAMGPELLGQLVVARTPAGPVRLGDVARIESSAPRSDRLDGKPLARVRVLFDVGVRKIALASLERELRALKGVQASIERDDVGAGICP